MLVRLQGSMWLDLNDLWIYKAFTYKCAEREKKKTESDKVSQPKARVRFICNSMPVFQVT